MSELMMQHEANVASRLRLGMPVLMPSRVRRELVLGRSTARPATAKPITLPTPIVPQRIRPGKAPIDFITSSSAGWIIHFVAAKHAVGYYDIVGTSRNRKHTAARREAVRTIKTHCPHLSLPTIGRLFHRDHSTVIYLLGKHRRGGKLPETARNE